MVSLNRSDFSIPEHSDLPEITKNAITQSVITIFQSDQLTNIITILDVTKS